MRAGEDGRNDELPRDEVEIEVLSLGPGRYDDEDRIVGRPVDRVRDTTGQSGGLPVLVDGGRVGSAVSMDRGVRDGNEVLIYRCRLQLGQAEFKALCSSDGEYWASHVRAVMWLNGVYPTSIHLS